MNGEKETGRNDKILKFQYCMISIKNTEKDGMKNVVAKHGDYKRKRHRQRNIMILWKSVKNEQK